MSEMILRLPSSYVDVESDEMEYVDGGGFVISTFKASYNNLPSIFISHFGSRANAFDALGTADLVLWMGSCVRFK